MKPDEEIRAKALEIAVTRYKGLPVSNVKAQLVVEEAKIYGKFITGESVDNSETPPKGGE